MMFKEKYALVLGGGGAKGAYQIGAWKALKEIGIKFNAVVGTSVGALNGALIAQNDFKKAYEVWQNISIEKIISIPTQIFSKKKEISFSKNDIPLLKNIRKNLKVFLKNKGLDTKPLRELIEQYVNEDIVRKSKIDFGIVAFQLNELKPTEIFLEDIEEGLLVDYLLASASLPGFKTTKIRGKDFTDGGVYDNIPYSMMKERGYKKIIIIDVSGLGVNRRPDTVGTDTIYIKCSSNIGSILSFEPEIANDLINIGYLDTLKAFNKINGIDYFYRTDKKLLKNLEKILLTEDVFEQYKPLLKNQECSFNKDEIFRSIKEILPKDLKNYFNPIIPLMECAASSLDIKKSKLYKLPDFLKIIWENRLKIEKKDMASSKNDFKSFFDELPEKIKSKSLQENFMNFIKHVPYEYEKALESVIGKKKASSHIKNLALLFPDLLPAKIFFIILNEYFKKNKQ